MFYLLKNLLLLILVIFKLKCNNLIFNEIMVLNASYVFTCILASSRITRSGSWKTDPSFLRWFCHNNYGLVTFIFRIKVHDQWGSKLRRSVRTGWTGPPEHSSWLPGILGAEVEMLKMVLGEVAGWCLLYLVAKPSHVGVDVDRLSCPLHRPMVCSH
jgi:hypothetical protein